jgi:hypothetical protein
MPGITPRDPKGPYSIATKRFRESQVDGKFKRREGKLLISTPSTSLIKTPAKETKQKKSIRFFWDENDLLGCIRARPGRYCLSKLDDDDESHRGIYDRVLG